MIDIKLVIVNEKYPDQLEKGEAIEVIDGSNKLSLIWGCPFCGKPTTTSHHTYDSEAKTLSPSIIHVADQCGWHGYLINGLFRDC